jgi:hypothetical protein
LAEGFDDDDLIAEYRLGPIVHEQSSRSNSSLPLEDGASRPSPGDARPN